jgi:predicted RNA binding protein YcfA (HicA-like mRNA interferase family)
VTNRLPTVSGSDLIDALERVGWEVLRQRGSHVRLRHSERQLFLVVPLHKELKRGTLNGILKDARLSREELNSLLRRS